MPRSSITPPIVSAYPSFSDEGGNWCPVFMHVQARLHDQAWKFKLISIRACSSGQENDGMIIIPERSIESVRCQLGYYRRLQYLTLDDIIPSHVLVPSLEREYCRANGSH
jgi:hypothetical protein